MSPEELLVQWQRELGVAFRDPALLQLALVHQSCLNESPGIFPESNERLEFLGDALIGLVIAHEVYATNPGRPEGELTAMRVALVRGDTLARVAASLQLGQFLIMGKGEETGGGRQRPSNLAGALEALAGALFLDQGYEAARDFILRLLSPELSSLGQQAAPKSAKSLLQELIQGRGLGAPSYRVVAEAGEDHARLFTAEVLVSGQVMGRGSGWRKSLAEQEAAQQALQALDLPA